MSRTGTAAVVGVLVGLLTGAGQAQGAVSLNQPLAADDPNRDKNWEWWHPGELHVLHVAGMSPAPSQPIPPFVNSGPAGILNVEGRWDIFPEQGWVLVLRDFGTVTRHVPVPFFVLYNTYRGILRVFYWSTQETPFASAVAKLSMKQGNAAFFTIADTDPRAFADEYTTGREQVALGLVMAHQWCYFDFDLMGYDPTLPQKQNLKFFIQIAGIDKSDVVLKLDGTAMPIPPTTTIAQKDEGEGFTNFIDGAIAIYKKPAQRYAELEDVRKKYQQMVDDTENKDKWWAKYVRKLGFLGNPTWISALGPVAGIIELITGGGSSDPSPPAPVAYHLDASLNGEITRQLPIYVLNFLVPGSHHTDPGTSERINTLPLYDKPLGVFNLLTRPKLEDVQAHQQGWCLDREYGTFPYFYESAFFRRLAEPIRYEVNPDSGLELKTIEAAFLPEDGFPEGYEEDVSDGYRSLGGDFESYGAWDIASLAFFDCNSIPDFEPLPRRIALRVTLEPPSPPAGFIPVTILKAYTPSHEPGGSGIGGTFPNSAPAIGALPPAIDVLVGQPLNLDVLASDANGDWVDFSVGGLPAGASFKTRPAFGDATAKLSWTPGADQTGTHTVTFRATDKPAFDSTSRTTSLRVLPCRPMVALAPPSPLGPYAGFETVTVAVRESCGLSLNLSWELRAEGGASYTVVSGCQAGPPGQASAASCTVRLGEGTEAITRASLRSRADVRALALAAPPKSVYAVVNGRDQYGNPASDRVTLSFRPPSPPCDGKQCEKE